jgi:(S)-mandelate dehydrogenase
MERDAPLDGRARPELHDLMGGLDSALNIADLRALAKRRLPRLVFDYIDGGAEDEIGVAENLAAFARHRLIPRFLTGCAGIDLTKRLLGRDYSCPFGIGPTGIAGLFHPGGDLLLAKAALAEGIPYVMSGTSSAAIEDLPPESAANGWYQLYTGRDKLVDEDIVRRARDAGFATLVLTVDSEVRTKRERDLRNGFGAARIKPSLLLEAFTHPTWVLAYRRAGGRPSFANFARYAGPDADAAAITKFMTSHLPGNPNWDDVARYRRCFIPMTQRARRAWVLTRSSFPTMAAVNLTAPRRRSTCFRRSERRSAAPSR